MLLYSRCEYANDPSELSLPGVTRLRLASSSIVNVNASSVGIRTLVDAAVAYNKLTQLEEEAKKEGQKVKQCLDTLETLLDAALCSTVLPAFAHKRSKEDALKEERKGALNLILSPLAIGIFCSEVCVEV